MKNVLITGGSKGIGVCLVETFVKKGYNVAFTYNNTEKEFEGAKGFKGDFASSAQTRRAISDAVEYLGGADILINILRNVYAMSRRDTTIGVHRAVNNHQRVVSREADITLRTIYAELLRVEQ